MNLNPEEIAWEAALTEGMDCEFMRINREIDELMKIPNPNTSHGKAQLYILRQLKEKISYGA